MLNLQDVRACIEQLQAIERETVLLDASKKTLTDLKDALNEKSSELKELELRHEVNHLYFFGANAY